LVQMAKPSIISGTINYGDQMSDQISRKYRRVVTGHDAEGRAKVIIDDLIPNVSSGRPGQGAHLIWTTEELPVAFTSDSDDKGAREIGTTIENGSVFRIVEYAPGVSPRNHRTESIDYAVVISGEIEMGLDDGEQVHLKAGDVLVQRGTIHNWENNGAEPCVIAFVLISSKPLVQVGRAVG
jgi:quercetin dioxygenase-like cupin family protein